MRVLIPPPPLSNEQIHHDRDMRAWSRGLHRSWEISWFAICLTVSLLSLGVLLCLECAGLSLHVPPGQWITQNYCRPSASPEVLWNAIWAAAASPAVFLKSLISNRFCVRTECNPWAVSLTSESWARLGRLGSKCALPVFCLLQSSLLGVKQGNQSFWCTLKPVNAGLVKLCDSPGFLSQTQRFPETVACLPLRNSEDGKTEIQL